MSGIKAVLDSNIFIYQLYGKSDVEEYFINFEPILSFVTELEVTSGYEPKSQDFHTAEILVNRYPIIGYLPELKAIIIKIRFKKKIKLADAIIAATAIYLNIPLVSADKDFFGIEGLDFIYHEPNLS